MISRRDNQKVKKASQASPSSVEKSQPELSSEMDSGAAEHVMLEGMLPRVKLERKTSPN